MGILAFILIAFSLSFDSFAVSVASGMSMCRKHMRIADSLKIATSLAFFQALMPVLGWFLGLTVKDWVEHFDHWIAFGLLAVLGGRMVWQGLHPHIEKVKNPTRWRVLIVMSLATSIDALAVGVSMAFIVSNMLIPALIIGFVTFGVSMLGLYMGRRTGKRLAGYAEIGGGLVLIVIGAKILLEHVMAV